MSVLPYGRPGIYSLPGIAPLPFWMTEQEETISQEHGKEYENMKMYSPMCASKYYSKYILGICLGHKVDEKGVYIQHL